MQQAELGHVYFYVFAASLFFYTVCNFFRCKKNATGQYLHFILILYVKVFISFLKKTADEFLKV